METTNANDLQSGVADTAPLTIAPLPNPTKIDEIDSVQAEAVMMTSISFPNIAKDDENPKQFLDLQPITNKKDLMHDFPDIKLLIKFFSEKNEIIEDKPINQNQSKFSERLRLSMSEITDNVEPGTAERLPSIPVIVPGILKRTVAFYEQQQNE